MDTRLLIRLVLPTASVGLLLLIVGLVAGWYVHRLQKRVAAVLEGNVASIQAAERLEIKVRRIQTLLYQYRLTENPTYLAQIPALVTRAADWMQEVERLADTPREVELVRQARIGFDRFRAEFHPEAGEDAADRFQAPDQLDDLIDHEIIQPVHAYLELNETAAVQSLDENQAVADRLVPALIMLAACGGTAGLLTGFGLARGVARSLFQLSIPVQDAAGKLGQVVGPITVSSVTRIADLDQMLQRMAAEVGTVVGRLQEAEREVLRREQLAAVGQLAAGVAHEMRNPLTSIKVLVQAAARRSDDPCLRGPNLTVVRAEIDRLESTIQAFLDFARPPRPEKRPVAADAVVRDTVTLVAARADQQAVRLVLDLPAEPMTVEADAGQLRQLAVNLVLNALDATPPRGTIEVRLRADPPGWLTIEVADNGVGLPAALGEKIFDPFTSTKDTGTGLGLSICRRVAESHGGTITGANRPGGGAVFVVRLPTGGQLK